MPRQKTQFANDEIYHISLRAVGDTQIFIDENDYFRGIFSIYEFNNSSFVTIQKRRRDRLIEKKAEKKGRCPTPIQSADKRDKMVDIFTFAFMPNHIHLLLRQLKDNGITGFMRKVGGGYANFFNKKYNRKGHLFNQFHAVHVQDDEQLVTNFLYIHSNPASLIEPGWKENGIENPKKVLGFLENYKWSSYRDYLGFKNFPSLTSRGLFLDLMGKEESCREATKNWIISKKR